MLPTLALIVAAFRKFMFIRDAASLFDMRQYSLMHFYSIFDNPLTLNSIYNAVEVGIITAVVGGALAFAIGYTIHRTRVPGRRSIDLMSTLPVAIPGPRDRRRLSVGLDRHSRRALRHHLDPGAGVHRALHAGYGQGAVDLVPADPPRARGSGLGLRQGHARHHHAPSCCRWRGPGVIASMTLLFVLAIRELGSSLFLYTSNTMVMSVLLLDYYEGGNLGKTAAFSLVQTVLLGVLIGGANWLSRGAAQGSVRATDKINTKGGSAMKRKIVARIVALAGIAGLGLALAARRPWRSRNSARPN